MSYVVGVDLGTTYTAAAVLRDGRVGVVELGDRAASVASVLWFRQDHGLVVGDAAVRRAASDPGRVAREFKRRFGDPVPVMVAGTPMSADGLMARLLRWVIEVVTEQEGGRPDVVGVTHPANWGPYKLDLLAQAVRLAGVDHARFVSEPHAAAESHVTGAQVPVGAAVAVYDLGGGTFDAAVLRRGVAGFELLGAEGIERLGGIDFDEAVFGHVRAAAGPGLTDLDQADPVVAAALVRLREDCAHAKEALSADTEVSIPVAVPGMHTTVRLCRGEFEEMIRPIVASTIGTLSRAITSAGLTPDQVSKVLLVGGSSRIPLVSLMIGTELGCPVALDTHPKHAVAMGSAYLAGREPSAAAAGRTRVEGAAVLGAAGGAPVGVGARATADAMPAADAMPGAGAAPIPVAQAMVPDQQEAAKTRVETGGSAPPVDSPPPPLIPSPSVAIVPSPGPPPPMAPRPLAPRLDEQPGSTLGTREQSRPVLVKRVTMAALFVVTAIVVTMSLSTLMNSATAEVFLEAAHWSGPDEFTDTVADSDNPKVPSPALGGQAGQAGQVISVSGDSVGLYGGSNNRKICNKDQLISFLAQDDAKSAVWASTLGIQPSEIDKYIAGLTPGLLQADTRVTNHGYRDGQATSRQAVLQAGTAVLADKRGMPQVKCGCGNPLTEPVGISEPDFTGDKWDGFDGASLTTVVPAKNSVQYLVQRDVHTGEASSRPVGTDGGQDVKSKDVVPVPGHVSAGQAPPESSWKQPSNGTQPPTWTQPPNGTQTPYDSQTPNGTQAPYGSQAPNGTQPSNGTQTPDRTQTPERTQTPTWTRTPPEPQTSDEQQTPDESGEADYSGVPAQQTPQESGSEYGSGSG